MSKKRPVIIISNKRANHKDYIVAKITSSIRNDEFTFWLNNDDLTENIRYESQVRTKEIVTISKKLVLRKFSSLKTEPLKELLKKIKENISYED
ncbi:MAG: type II toxin-antitoxin system PemK/MazF family toxin [Bacteroidales bacterium]|nr:type II toxin-antitoxin system PemK/MazF family toxin [Bacteroidales bacterium]